MGRPPGWAAALTGRAVMRSPGRPPVRRDLERAFWGKIAEGLTSEDAAMACGVSGPVGSRWFRHAGGMPPIDLTPVSGRYLCFSEREQIAVMRAEGVSMRMIADRIGRSPSTISRELRRNAATRNGKLEYRASTAQWKADLAARRPKPAKLAVHSRLREYVQDKLSGVIRDGDGNVVGPFASWKGRNRPRRADRRWATAWSPQQISNRLPIDFPDDESMRISHEAVYQSLDIEGRGALERELVACLRTGRALRKPRARTKKLRTGFITDDVTIGARPDEVDDRAIAGHWEGDLIIGLNRSADRHRRRVDQSIHNAATSAAQRRLRHSSGGQERAGPVRVWDRSPSATLWPAALTPLPEHLRRSVTWDRGKELARHAELTAATGISVYFCDPYSPWQRGTNENTNGLLRQYFPKGTDLARYDRREVQAVADALNDRPRKTLGWNTPAEVLADQLHSRSRHGVATTS